MPTREVYAQMSNRAYTRTDENRAPKPPGWDEIQYIRDGLLTGFSAGVYKSQSGNEIVIAFTGTNEWQAEDWLVGNIPSGISLPSFQVTQAMKLYLDVKAQNPGATITFTGHSLGAGLASLMAVFFNRTATVFDNAPFQASAVNPLTIGIYSAYMVANGYTDSDFFAYANGTDTFASREPNVTAYFLDGEALQGLRTSLTAIEGSSTPYVVGPQSHWNPIDRHSITLLTAAITSQSFNEMLYANPNALALFFDDSIYKRSLASSKERDFLSWLVNNQTINTAPLLDRFAADVAKLASVLPTDGAMHNALFVAAMDYYYLKDPAQTSAFFSVANGGLHFNFDDIGLGGYKSLPRLRAAIESMMATEWGTDKEFYSAYLLTQNAWHIQSGANPLSWVASSGATDKDAVVGGAGADVIDAGANSDVVLGGDGGDDITGGAGNDLMFGGAGFDTYRFAAGFGRDVVMDSDGGGRLMYGADQLTGGLKVSENEWQTDPIVGTPQFRYTLVADGAGGNSLVIKRVGSSDVVTSASVRAAARGQSAADAVQSAVNSKGGGAILLAAEAAGWAGLSLDCRRGVEGGRSRGDTGCRIRRIHWAGSGDGGLGLIP